MTNQVRFMAKHGNHLPVPDFEIPNHFKCKSELPFNYEALERIGKPNVETGGSLKQLN